MIRYSEHQVELTDSELNAHCMFGRFLDDGETVREAAAHTARIFPALDEYFYQWLQS